MSNTPVTLTTTMQWEVQTLLSNGKWTNCWSNTCDGITTPVLFTTQEEAQQELDQFLAEFKAETKEEFEGQLRVQAVPVYDPAPKYDTGTRFKMRSNGQIMNLIITYRFWNGEAWSYQVGVDVGPVGQVVPEPFAGAFKGQSVATPDGDRNYVDYLTLEEDSIESNRLPKQGEAPRYVWARGFGSWKEYYNPKLGWVNRLHAKVYDKTDLTTYTPGPAPEGYWEIVA